RRAAMADEPLAESSFCHIINAPVEQVDIADWLLNLKSAEFQRCCPAQHIAAAATMTEDGKRMALNVETMGDSVIVQHFIGEVTDPHFCRLVSRSDVFTPAGRTKLDMVWQLSVWPMDAERCEYTNRVSACATDDFLGFLSRRRIALAEARAAQQ